MQVKHKYYKKYGVPVLIRSWGVWQTKRAYRPDLGKFNIGEVVSP